MAEPRTRRTSASVTAFLARIEDPGRRRDARAVLKLMREVTGARPAMWGSSIVGFGTYRQPYASGEEREWPVAAFSPRKQNLVLYLTPGFEGQSGLMAKLGKHRTGKCCLYLNHLDDLHLPPLRMLIRWSVRAVRRQYRSAGSRDRG